MQADRQDLPALVKEVRRQLSLSQEGLTREPGGEFCHRQPVGEQPCR